MTPHIFYFICTLPRSGSWLLSEALERTGIAGRPREYFEPKLFEKHSNATYAEAVSRIIRTGTTNNGVFGAKFHWYQFEYAPRVVRTHDDSDTPVPLLMAARFPNLRYIWLTRRDKVRQAVSYYRAIKTGQWWKIAGVRNGKSAQPPLEFDYAYIQRLEKLILAHEAKWQKYFEEFDIDPLVLVYEEFCRNVGIAVREVLAHLGIAQSRKQRLRARLQRQADTVTEEWVERYTDLKRREKERDRPYLTFSAAELRSRSFPEIRDSKRSAQSPQGAPRLATVGNRTSQRVINNHEIVVSAIQRSGHHAVINWIAAQCTGSILFLNDVQPGTNPYLTCTQASRLDLPGAPGTQKGTLEPFTLKNYLIYNYEDRPLDALLADSTTQRESWIGPSAVRYDIIVLRDPFNTFASRLRAGWMRHQLGDKATRATVVGMWKTYAREYLRRSQAADAEQLAVSYNRWFLDEAYRQGLSAQLNLKFSDRGLQGVAGRYGGSSFDGVRFDGAAAQMSVFDRWRFYAEDLAFRELFQDRELVDFSAEIFGSIPGTQALTA
jgi:LPS sulfotransferase NodH